MLGISASVNTFLPLYLEWKFWYYGGKKLRGKFEDEVDRVIIGEVSSRQKLDLRLGSSPW